MLLSDRSIKEEIAKKTIIIRPYEEKNVQPSSYDIRLDNKFLVFRHTHHPFIDLKKRLNELTTLIEINENKPFMLHPGEFVLGSTYEHLTLPRDIAARIEGKSSLGRVGILIHSTAGYVDPGWKGNLTLEISNVAKLPVTLYYKMKIGQLSFVRMTTPADVPYGSPKLRSKYHGSTKPVPSRLYDDFKKYRKLFK
jgi:dCTP deaminase